MDSSELQSLAQCVKANTWRVFLDNALSLWPSLTTNCQTQYDFFSNPALWDEKFPAYFREYADTCGEELAGAGGRWSGWLVGAQELKLCRRTGNVDILHT